MNDLLNLREFIDYLELNMVLNNNIIKYHRFELLNHEELWEDFILDLQDDSYSEDELEEMFVGIVEDVFQYYMVPEREVNDWLRYTDYPIYFSKELDMYLVGITHFGMGWEFFKTTYPRPTYMKK